jgi:hypothetical protein
MKYCCCRNVGWMLLFVSSLFKESQSTVILRALCEAKNSVVFENSHTLKMICISFIINKKTLMHLPAYFLMKSWFLPHRLLRSRSSFMLWWSRNSAKDPVFPRFLSFPSKGRLFKYRWTYQRYFFLYTLTVGLPRYLSHD